MGRDFVGLFAAFFAAFQDSWVLERLTNKDGRCRPQSFQRLVSAANKSSGEAAAKAEFKRALQESCAAQSKERAALLIEALRALLDAEWVGEGEVDGGEHSVVEAEMQTSRQASLIIASSVSPVSECDKTSAPSSSAPTDTTKRPGSAATMDNGKARHQSRWLVSYSERQKLVARMEHERGLQKRKRKQAWVSFEDGERLVEGLWRRDEMAAEWRLSSLDLELMRLNQSIFEGLNGLAKTETVRAAPEVLAMPLEQEPKKTRLTPIPSSSHGHAASEATEAVMVDLDCFWEDFSQACKDEGPTGRLARSLERHVDRLAEDSFFGKDFAKFRTEQPYFGYYAADDDGRALVDYVFDKDPLSQYDPLQTRERVKFYRERAYRFRRSEEVFVAERAKGTMVLTEEDRRFLGRHVSLLDDWFRVFESIRRVLSERMAVVLLTGRLTLSRALAVVLVFDVPFDGVSRGIWSWEKFGLRWTLKELKNIHPHAISKVVTSHRSSLLVQAIEAREVEYPDRWYSLLPFLRSLESARTMK